jgi:TolB protein
MPNKAQRLRILDQLEEPDLWSDIRGRQPRRPPEEPRAARRVLVAAVAIGVAAAAIAFVGRAFEVAVRTPRPASTPSNGQLAFSGGGEIYVVSPDGSGLRQVTDLGGHDALHVHWSPDGSKLAFRVWSKGNFELFVMNADGSGVTNVTGSMGVSEFAWSSDGSMLAFTSFQEGSDFDVFVVNAYGTGLRAVVESPLTEHRPQWSPDGARIAYEQWPVHDRDPGTADIYAIGVEGGEAVPLVTSSGWDTEAAWSPDGRRIAFSSERDGDEEIYVVNADGSGERKLTDLPGVDATNAAWSPDGAQISFVAHDGEQWDDWVVNADGSGLTRLTPIDRDDGPAVWAPDGSLLAFTASEVTGNVDNTGTYYVYTIRPDRTGERRITSGRFAMGWDLSWQPVASPEATSTPTETPTPSPVSAAEIGQTIDVGQASALLYADGSLWVDVLRDAATNTGTVLRIDPGSGEVQARIAVDAYPGSEHGGSGMIFAGQYLWVVGTRWSADGPAGGILVRIDPETDTAETIEFPVGVIDIDLVFDDGFLWTTGVSSPGKDPRVLQIDPATGAVVSETPIDAEWWGGLVVEGGANLGHGDVGAKQHRPGRRDVGPPRAGHRRRAGPGSRGGSERRDGKHHARRRRWCDLAADGERAP